MPFLRLHNNKINHSTVNSLRARLSVLHQSEPVKRASSFTSWKFRASLTVEAAFALPLFLFFMIQIMSAMNIIGLQGRLGAALHQTGNEIAFAGYGYGAIAGIPVENQIIDYVGKQYLNQSCIKNGAAGISFDGTSIKKNDIVEIYLSYQVQPLFPIMGFDDFIIVQRYYGRAWTGYDVEGTINASVQTDPMVYITETGTVYHTNRNCTYLNPSVETIPIAAIAGSRNQSGGKYYPCEICGGKGSVEAVYITNQGSSYHSTVMCPGLKRTIYTVPLSQVGGRGRCSKCR